MQVQKAFNARLTNYLYNIDQYAIIGWQQQEFFHCTNKYPFTQKSSQTHPTKNPRKTLPSLKHKFFRDHKKLEPHTENPPITSHLLCPTKHLPTNVTSIRFTGSRESIEGSLKIPKNSKSVTSKSNRPLSRLLIELSPEHCSSPKSKNFVLHGEKTRYFKKKGKRQTQCFFRVGEDKDPLFEEMLSMTIPCWRENVGTAMVGKNQRPVDDWFNGSKEAIMGKVGRQIKGRRSLSQKLKL